MIVINCPKLYQVVVYYNTMHCVERVIPREVGLWVLFVIVEYMSIVGQIVAIFNWFC